MQGGREAVSGAGMRGLCLKVWCKGSTSLHLLNMGYSLELRWLGTRLQGPSAYRC